MPIFKKRRTLIGRRRTEDVYLESFQEYMKRCMQEYELSKSLQDELLKSLQEYELSKSLQEYELSKSLQDELLKSLQEQRRIRIEEYFQRQSRGRCYETEGKGGLFVLLNDENDRAGSEVDRQKLVEFFKTTLKFDVMDINAFGTISIIDFLKKVKRMAIDKSDNYYCLVFFIGCHGSKEYLSFRNMNIKFDDIKERFNGTHLNQYRGRPKIFLTQFCRGDQNERGGVPEMDSLCTTNLYGNENADICVVFSTAKEKVAYRNPKTGSVAVDKCVETFNQDWRHHHLEAMMLTVREKVADWISFDTDFETCRQTAVVETSLTKRLYFEPAGCYA